MDLNNLHAMARAEQAAAKPHRLRCCTAAGCLSLGSGETRQALEGAVREAGLQDRVEVRGVGCLGLCSRGPLVRADPAGPLYE